MLLSKHLPKNQTLLENGREEESCSERYILTSVPIGEWKCNFPAFLGYYDRSTNHQTIQSTKQPTDGHGGSSFFLILYHYSQCIQLSCFPFLPFRYNLIYVYVVLSAQKVFLQRGGDNNPTPPPNRRVKIHMALSLLLLLINIPYILFPPPLRLLPLFLRILYHY